MYYIAHKTKQVYEVNTMTTYILMITYTDGQIKGLEIEFSADYIEWMIRQLVENDMQVVNVTYQEK